MFIIDGKSLFGNNGLILSLCILLILLYFSYNKCYINKQPLINNIYQQHSFIQNKKKCCS